jgi:hypothetical protein
MTSREIISEPIRTQDVKLENETSASFDAVKKRFKALDPSKASDAGDAYLRAANELAKKAESLSKRHAPALIAAWGGDAAQQALDQMGRIHWTANELAGKSAVSAQTLKWYGTEILPWYKNLGDKMSDGTFHTGKDDTQARMLMNRLNLRTNWAQAGFPAEVKKDLPSDKGGVTPNGPGGPGGPGGGMPTGGGGGGMPKGAKLPKSDPFGNMNDNKNPHLPDDSSKFPDNTNLPKDNSSFPNGSGNGTNLAGFHPPGGGGGLPDGGGGPGGDPFGKGGLGGGGLGGGGLGGLGPNGLGGGGLGGVGGTRGAGAAGSLGSAAAADEAAAAGNAGRMGGAGMMPMAPGGAGQGQQERDRSTWLHEDEDVWGAVVDVTPPLIG